MHLDAESGLSIPYIPDPQHYEVHIVENTITSGLDFALYFPISEDPETGDGGYDPNAYFFSPMLAEPLRSEVAQRHEMWKNLNGDPD
jgi:hypothetical protein